MTENLNPLYSPSNLIFLLWFQLPMIFSFLIYHHLFVCSIFFFSGAIHHLTSSEIVVKTKQKSQEARKCLFTKVKKKSIFLSILLSLPLPVLHPPPSVKSCWIHSDLTPSVLVSPVFPVLNHLPYTCRGCVVATTRFRVNYNGLFLFFYNMVSPSFIN